MSTESKSKRYGTAIARILLGLVFLAAGVVGLVLRPQPKGMPADAMAFFEAMANTHYMLPLVSGTEALGGALLLINRFAPLGLAFLAPVIVNIMLFHIFLAPSGIPVACVVLALELFLAWSYRKAFAPILAMRN
jgi:uncharacterized membrane protein YphA (DoxX/SURF4 family)